MHLTAGYPGTGRAAGKCHFHHRDTADYGCGSKNISGQTQVEDLTTDSSGQTPAISFRRRVCVLSGAKPAAAFCGYTIQVEAPGYRPVEVSNVAIFRKKWRCSPLKWSRWKPHREMVRKILSSRPTRCGEIFRPKIAEDEIKPMDESGEIVLSRVVIPEYVIVHDGPPSDRGAKDYYVPLSRLHQNVASGEIYSTWPDAALRANILAIMSFTLNRVYTEWYRNKSYDFYYHFLYGLRSDLVVGRQFTEIFHRLWMRCSTIIFPGQM